jgi:hypothetical protein
MNAARSVWALWWILALGFAGAGCGAGGSYLEDSSAETGAASDGAAPVSASVSSGEPTPPTRCDRACRHIATLTAPSSNGDARAAWMPGCVDRCEEHASQGQLECYDRARTATELELCMVH